MRKEKFVFQFSSCCFAIQDDDAETINIKEREEIIVEM